jgi:Protein of unknown function (DUF2958)
VLGYDGFALMRLPQASSPQSGAIIKEADMQLIPDDVRTELLLNGTITARGIAHDPFPVVKLFTPDAGATWLLTELNPEYPDVAFGLCDLGLGSPELGYVSITELESVRGGLGLPVERDLHFKGDKPLSEYTKIAAARGRIQT